VREWARWQLGPFQNDEALKSLEEDILKEIRSGKGGSSNTAELWITLAEDRLQFEQWAKAIEALKRAQTEDQPVALCGQGKHPSAEQILRTMAAEDRGALLEKYPVLERMAKDAKYRDLFPARP
jgi:hypothetical protein